jgi:hypothetical protein
VDDGGRPFPSVFLRIIPSPLTPHVILIDCLAPETNISKQSGIDQWLGALREHMRQSDFSRWAIK